MWGLFPYVDPEELEEAVRILTWTVHGGSGFTWTRADVLSMSIGDIENAVEWMNEQRKREAKALERASKRPGR